MNILIAGDFRVPWREQAWVDGFKSLGHRVRSVSISSMSISGNLSEKVYNKILLDRTNANKRLLQASLEENFDIIFLIRPCFIKRKVLEAIRSNTNSKLVLHNNDSMFGPAKSCIFRNIIDTLDLYDTIFVYRDWEHCHYKNFGARNVWTLYPFYIPNIHKNTWESKKRFCGFFGHFENDNRIRIYKSIVRNNLIGSEICFRGSGWDKIVDFSKQHETTQPVIGENYVHYLNTTEICLGIYSSLNRDFYSRRTFEIPACGALLVSQRNRYVQSFFEEDKEAVYFSSTEELISKLVYLYNNKDKLAHLAKCGFERVRASSYSIYDACRRVLTYA